jgi:hypothetical protein
LVVAGLLAAGCSDDKGSESSPTEPENPQCAVTPTQLDFGVLAPGDTKDLSFTVRNSGNGTLTGEVTEDCPEFSIVSGGGSFSLGAGESLTVTVRYAPEQEGQHTCSVQLGTECASVVCTGDATSMQPPPEVQPPEVTDSVDDVGNTAANALIASMLQLMEEVSSIPYAFFAYLENADWDLDGDCWVYTVQDSAGCLWKYRVCLEGDTFVWTLSLDGSCYGEEFDDWVYMEATTSLDGSEGTLVIYEYNSTDVFLTVTWVFRHDWTEAVWKFYKGTESSENLFGILEWYLNEDNSQAWYWTMPETTKWVIAVSTDQTAGYMDIYMWSESRQDWWMKYEIRWNGGHGTWYTFNEDGDITHEVDW